MTDGPRLPGLTTRHQSSALILLLALTSPAWAQPPVRDVVPTSTQSTSIQGRVLIAGGDVPVYKARVDLVSATGEVVDSVYSGVDGQFVFTAPAGRYTVSAWKSGHVLTTFGARTYWDAPTALALRGGERVDNLTLALTRASAISGRVTDEYGEPMMNMTVTAGRVLTIGDRPHLQPVGSQVTTDDLGEYRLGGLPAGSFVVSVFGLPPGTRPDSGQRARGMFFPQATFLPQARALTVRAGEEQSGIDVMFPSVSAAPFRVTGRVVDEAGLPARANVTALAIADGVPGASLTRLTTSASTGGEFSIGLPPGAYRVIAQDGPLVGMTELRAEGDEGIAIQLTLTRGARVSGRVVFAGTTARPAEKIVVVGGSPGLGMGAGPRADVVDDFQRTAAAPDGAFELTGLMGRRQLGVSPLPKGWAVKSITAGGRHIADVPIDFAGTEDLRNVVITMTDRRPQLSGIVLDEQGAPAAGVSVLVFADDRRLLPRRARWLHPDHDGRFAFDDLPAGDYLLAVAPDVDDQQWKTVEYLDRFRAGATRVALADGEQRSVTLKWPAR